MENFGSTFNRFWVIVAGVVIVGLILTNPSGDTQVGTQATNFVTGTIKALYNTSGKSK